MVRKTLLAALMGAALTAPAFAQNSPMMIRSIDVETSLDSLNNAEAAAYWRQLDTDLEAAIAAQLVGRIGDDGYDLRIDMNELELANFFQAQTGTAETMMSGTVKVSDLQQNMNYNVFDLTVRMNQALPLLPAGTDIMVIPRTSPEVYSAMVATFAAAVVDRIDN